MRRVPSLLHTPLNIDMHHPTTYYCYQKACMENPKRLKDLGTPRPLELTRTRPSDM